MAGGSLTSSPTSGPGGPRLAPSRAGRAAAPGGGMRTLAETAACEWSASGVRVNVVAPGGIVSSGFDTYTPELQKKLHEFTERCPVKRFGTEAEISAAITYSLSPAAAYITGSCIRVDGGTPNARTTWKLEPHSRSVPFEGFPRAKVPEVMKRQARA